MKVMVIGGTGHIGQFLTLMLVEAGHEVLVVTRGRLPVPAGAAWKDVRLLAADSQREEELRALTAHRPEVVIDIPGTAMTTYRAFRGSAQHVVAVGSLWMFGEPRVVPTPEETQGPCPFEGYARRYADIRRMVSSGAADGLAFTAVMPPNICGPGSIPLDCLGGRDIELHRAHARGEEVVLPEGPEAIVGPCDAEDVARCIVLAVEGRQQAAGQVFNVGSATAITWTELVAAYSEIHGVTIPIRRVSWSQYVREVSPGMGHWFHLKAAMCPDIGKARRLLGYEPRYSPRQALERAVEWMRREKLL